VVLPYIRLLARGARRGRLEAREPLSPDSGQPLSLLLVSAPRGAAYSPIDCSLHDRLEELATLRRECSIAYRGADGEQRETRGRIVDVFARGGEEFVMLDGGAEVRLDRLEEVDGVPYRGGERC
jgi:Rho-binding antiterminator